MQFNSDQATDEFLKPAEEGTDETDFRWRVFSWKSKSAPATPAPSPSPSSSSSSELDTDPRANQAKSPECVIARLVGTFHRAGPVDRCARLDSTLQHDRQWLDVVTRRGRTPLEHLCHRFRRHCEKLDATRREVEPDAVKTCSEMTQILIRHGAKVDSNGTPRRRERSALHDAAANFRFPVDALDALFRATKSPDVEDAKGNTPLHLALEVRPECFCFDHVRIMLEAGCRLDRTNAAGKTPLDVFVSRLTTWTELKPKAVYSAPVPDILHLIAEKASEDDDFGQSKHAWSLLCLTLLVCPAHSAERLFSRGISTELEHSDDLSSKYPFAVAAGMSADDPMEKLDLISRHLPASFINAHDVDGRSLAHHAAQQRDVELMRKAHSAGIDLTKEDNRKYTPLRLAASATADDDRTIECLKFLTDRGEYSTGAKCAALASALKRGNRRACAALLATMDSVGECGISKLGYECAQLLTADEDLVLDSANPLRVCLELSREFSKAADLDSATHRQDFNELAQGAESLAVDLLSGCQSKTVRYIVDDDLIDYAIAKRQKQFIASPAVQEYIGRAWHSIGSHETERRSKRTVVASVVIGMIVMLLFPFAANRIVPTFPLLSFIANAISMIVFLVLLVVGVVVNGEQHFDASAPTLLDWILFVFCVGFVVRKITKGVRLLSRKNHVAASHYLVRKQTITDAVLLFVFAVYFGLLFAAYYGTSSSSTRETLVRASFHVYGVAVLGWCISSLNLLQFHSRLGPIQVSFISITRVTLMFLVILCAFWAGFALSITSVHTASVFVTTTRNATRSDDASVETARDGIKGVWVSLRSLFWALFGMIEVESFESPTGPENVVGMLLLAVWLVVSVIVLLNMLIALINNSFQRVEDNADLEWKFSRAKVVRDMASHPVVPVPLNLVSLPVEIVFFALNANQKKKKNRHASKEHLESVAIDWKANFRKQSAAVVERYRKRRERRRKKDGASKADLLNAERQLNGQLQREMSYLQEQVFRMGNQIDLLVNEFASLSDKGEKRHQWEGGFRVSCGKLSRRWKKRGGNRTTRLVKRQYSATDDDTDQGVTEVDLSSEQMQGPFPAIFVRSPSGPNEKIDEEDSTAVNLCDNVNGVVFSDEVLV